MLIYLFIGIFSAVSALEYDVDYNRLVLAYFDKDLVKDSYFHFKKYNRTNFSLNVSFNLLEDLNGSQMKFTTRGYQYWSNQFKPFGFHLSFNVCEYWKKNIYGTTEHLANFGNLEGCDIKKGHYYLYNYMPDERAFPKYIPAGIYMVEITVEWYSGRQLLKFEWYITATLKVRQRVFHG